MGIFKGYELFIQGSVLSHNIYRERKSCHEIHSII